MEDKTFAQRRTKALKSKEKYEKNGKFSSKHLRISEELKNKEKKILLTTSKS